MEKPDVDLIEGLSPAISIEQKATSHNPRSTVGTVTEIHDYHAPCCLHGPAHRIARIINWHSKHKRFRRWLITYWTCPTARA